MTSLKLFTSKPLCKEGDPVMLVCISENCSHPNPFVCANSATEPCYHDHRHCRKELWETFCERLLKHQPKSKGFKELELSVNKLLDKLQIMLKESKTRFSKWLAESCYSEDVKNIIDSINDKKYSSLSGNDLYYVFRDTVGVAKHQDIKFLKYYEKRAETIFSLMKTVQISVVSLYSEEVEINPQNNQTMHSFSFGNQSQDDERKSPHKDEIDWRNLAGGKEIHLQNKLKEEVHLNRFQRMHFGNATVLRLSNNNLKDLNWMKGMAFPSLLELCLDYNMIEDLSPLQDMFFPLLRGLYLQYNQIESLKPLTKFHSPYLEILNLNYNQIKVLDDLERCRFDELQRLFLHDNDIDNISVFLRLRNFPKLQWVTLQTNPLPYQAEEFKKLMVSIRSRYLKCSFRVQEQ